MNRDPENLKIPAFMRKRSLSRSKQSGNLMLTALERQLAGKTEAYVEKTSRTINRVEREVAATTTNRQGLKSRGAYPVVEGLREETPLLKPTQRSMWDIAIESVNKDKHHGPKIPRLRVRRPATPKKPTVTQQTFKSPILEDAQQFTHPTPESQKFHEIGTLTHYFAKISVAVIALREPLKVGDTIMYETPHGIHKQVVSSMEMDRVPIFKGRPGQDVGLKIDKAAVTDTRVYQTK